MSEKTVSLRRKTYAEITKEDFFGINTPPIIEGGVYYLNLNQDEDFNRPYIALPTNIMEPISMTNMQRFIRVTSGQYSFWDIPVGISNDALSFAATNEIVVVQPYRLRTSDGDFIYPKSRIHPMILNLIVNSAYRANNPSVKFYNELVQNIYMYCKHVESFNIPIYTKVHKTSYKDAAKGATEGPVLYKMEFEVPSLLCCSPVLSEKGESENVFFEGFSEREEQTPNKKAETSDKITQKSEETRKRMRIGQILKQFKTNDSLKKKEIQGIDVRSHDLWTKEIMLRYIKIYETHTEAALCAAFGLPKSIGKRILTSSYYGAVSALEQEGIPVKHVYDENDDEVPVPKESDSQESQEPEGGSDVLDQYETEQLHPYIDVKEIERHFSNKSTPSIETPQDKFSLAKMREFIQMDGVGQQNALMRNFGLSSRAKIISLRGKIINELDARNEPSVVSGRLSHTTKYFSLVDLGNGLKTLHMDEVGRLVFLTDAAKYPKKYLMEEYGLKENEYDYILEKCIDFYRHSVDKM